MPLKQKPQPQLHVPVLTFPLSSPISEEIESPPCSSAEDHEEEHNRPFAFLSKATRQKLEAKASKDGTGTTNRSPTFPQISKVNIRGISKKRKSVAKPLGLNLVTNFILAPTPEKRGTSQETAAAPFVDLNDLKLLSKVRERERTAQKSKETFKKRASRGFQRLPDEQTKEQTQYEGSFLNQQLESADTFHDRHEHGLSPSDRHVMIGLTVPTSESMDRAKELDDQHTPLTPSIIVTPAREEAPWNTHSNSSTEALRPPRVASSVYSQPTPRLWQFESDVPPVPAIPAQHFAKTKGSEGGFLSTNLIIDSGKRPASITSTVWEDDSPRGESPPTTAKSSTANINTNTSPQKKNIKNNPFTNANRLSVNTETDRPTSQGWWTYLLSPLLGRPSKSPLSPSFPQSQDSPSSSASTPSPTTTRKESRWWAREKERYKEKEISCFSPDTPETAAPMGEKNFEQIRGIDTETTNMHGQQSFPDLVPDHDPAPAYEFATAPAPRQQTMSFMFGGGQTIQGEAAEYYQACAHELFSKTPYFECVGHVCSITPMVNTGAGVIGETRDLTDNGGSHGLAIVAVDESGRGVNPNSGSTLDPTRNSNTATKDSGLLIDIDSPKPKSVISGAGVGADAGASAASAKEVLLHSPASDASSDSWDSSVVDVQEKGAVAEQATREVPAVVEHQPPTPAPAPAPVAVPMPEPQPAPAPIPMPEPQPALAPPQVITNISPPVVHYPPHPPQPQGQSVQPIIVPQYIPVYPPGQPVQPEQPAPVLQEQQPLEQTREIASPPQTGPASQGLSSGSDWPWPYGQEVKVPVQPAPSIREVPRGVETDRQAHVPQTIQVPQMAEPQPQGTEWMYGQRRHLQAPLVVQGRESGSGWPFSHRQQQQQAAPPLPQAPPQGFEWAYGYQGQQNSPAGQAQAQAQPDEAEPLHRQQQAQVQAQTLPQERQREPESPNGERGQPQGISVAQEQEPLTLLAQPQGPGLAPRQAPASEPISPGFQRAAGGPGSIPMADMQAPAPAYTQFPRDAPLPPRYDVQPRYAPHAAGGATIVNPGGAIGPYETRRRRLEREDAAGRKAGGLWRGRGPFSKKGCFGRPGREGRTRRRWYLVIFLFFFIIVVLAIVLAITLTKKGDPTPVQSQWLNLTGYPPMPTGIATLAGTEPQVQKSTCITPSSMWSCALPKSQQEANEPFNADQPNFRVSISFRNGTYDNSTTVGSNSTQSQRRRSDLFNPSPAAPSNADQAFIGQYTDNNSAPYSGEETPFYMSMLSPISLSSTNLYRRSTDTNSTLFPNLTSVIPPPDENADGSAAAAMLYPLPASQPIRLYNRGQPTEHYGFYTYFDKSIYLTSQTQSEPADSPGGTSRADSKYRCTWSQTRFLVQIWTQPDKSVRRLLPSTNTTATATSKAATSTSTNKATSSSSATNFSRPGSFPYPVTITIDRHGGADKKKMVYCYAMEDDGHYNITAVQLQLEDRAVGGAVINPAGGIFESLSQVKEANSTEYGGVDGGTGGCQCQYVNWIATV
ncbi:uncharacterized protein N7446_005171 [Penicillium canescens]|uniref:Glycoprotease family protein n=1 Tax=Penicillium canescens TaxID=5083 RepID=A0AAD6I9A7_PENCN|nr:uncharacterized protein N7446_005171 [Penicillium canescens]KAJ6038367.1 hypothetical protein N7460_008138 [Penicillium canescens]KAJ6039516.1 hypothetical protein N7444_008421 [Penicillium canescens]KAJ6068134.1 hypothetical protein N7446_005171 [Penicillium canescens]